MHVFNLLTLKVSLKVLFSLSNKLSSIFFFIHLRSPVNTLSTVVFNILVRFKVCHKPVRTYDVGAPSAITISLPGMDPADAERRRYLVFIDFTPSSVFHQLTFKPATHHMILYSIMLIAVNLIISEFP